MCRFGDVHLKRSDVDSSGVEPVEPEHVRQVGERAVGLVGAVGGDEPRRGLAGSVHRQPVDSRVSGGRGVVAADDGQRGEVGAVVGVQVGEQ